MWHDAPATRHQLANNIIEWKLMNLAVRWVVAVAPWYQSPPDHRCEQVTPHAHLKAGASTLSIPHLLLDQRGKVDCEPQVRHTSITLNTAENLLQLTYVSFLMLARRQLPKIELANFSVLHKWKVQIRLAEHFLVWIFQIETGRDFHVLMARRLIY